MVTFGLARHTLGHKKKEEDLNLQSHGCDMQNIREQNSHLN